MKSLTIIAFAIICSLSSFQCGKEDIKQPCNGNYKLDSTSFSIKVQNNTANVRIGDTIWISSVVGDTIYPQNSNTGLPYTFNLISMYLEAFSIKANGNMQNLFFANNEFNINAFDGQIYSSNSAGFSYRLRKFNKQHFGKLALVPGVAGKYAIKLDLFSNQTNYANYLYYTENCTNYRVFTKVPAIAQNLSMWNNWNQTSIFLQNGTTFIDKESTNYILLNVIP